MKRKVAILLATIGLIFNSSPIIKGEETQDPKFKVAPIGRLLIDGAFYFSPEKDLFKDGMAISEARLGASFEYGKWSSWIDVGFAYGKIGLRNMWIQYDFNENNSLRVGNYVNQYGLQSNSTANNKATFEVPLAAALYTPGIQMGALYTFQNKSIFSASGFHVESSALTNVMNYPEFNKQGYTLLSRFAWRKKDSGINGKSVVHAGVSIGFSTPQRHLDENGYDVHDAIVNSANYPTKVTNLPAISATVTNARNLFKFTPELMLAKGKVGLEAQYFFQTIDRKGGLRNVNSHSGYITLRGLLRGGNYSYDFVTTQLVNPKKHALECVLDYNYSTLTDARAGIYGGRANNFNATLNYYINKYITARLNYSYTHVWGREGYNPVSQNVIQARLMLLF